ncbi:hypothetical protein [Lysobacter gummosus]|uniref:hypothetical protein n=1 Tax=Lysobacter gummosus TaxID=262324 RepID=UPI00363616E9
MRPPRLAALARPAKAANLRQARAASRPGPTGVGEALCVGHCRCSPWKASGNRTIVRLGRGCAILTGSRCRGQRRDCASGRRLASQ